MSQPHHHNAEPVREPTELMANLDQRRPRDRELAVESAEELLQRRRLESILDAIENVELVDGAAAAAKAAGQINEHAHNIAVLSALQRAIRACYGLLIKHENQRDDDEPSIYWHGVDNRPLGFLHFEDTSTRYGFYGLDDILHADDVYTETWEETVKHRNCAPTTEEHVERKTVPRQVTWNGYLLLRAFLTEEVGIVLDADDAAAEHRSDTPGV